MSVFSHHDAVALSIRRGLQRFAFIVSLRRCCVIPPAPSFQQNALLGVIGRWRARRFLLPFPLSYLDQMKRIPLSLSLLRCTSFLFPNVMLIASATQWALSLALPPCVTAPLEVGLNVEQRALFLSLHSRLARARSLAFFLARRRSDSNCLIASASVRSAPDGQRAVGGVAVLLSCPPRPRGAARTTSKCELCRLLHTEKRREREGRRRGGVSGEKTMKCNANRPTIHFPRSTLSSLGQRAHT